MKAHLAEVLAKAGLKKGAGGGVEGGAALVKGMEGGLHLWGSSGGDRRGGF